MGAHLRPTTDRVRESLFNVLMHYDVLEQAHVLDLFAGTGALGLEALSRGAAHVTFVDQGRVAAKLLSQNIAKLKAADETRFIKRDARVLPPNDGPACTVVFLDPPYGKDLGAPALLAAEKAGWLTSGALVVWEESSPIEPPNGYTLEDRRTYGDTHVTLMSKS